MIPAEHAYPDIHIDYDSIYRMNDVPLTTTKARFYRYTCNGQTLPDMFLKDTVAVIAYDWFDDPAKQFLAKEILAVNPHDHTACLRKRDKARFKALVERHNYVMSYYYKNKEKIDRRYAESAKTLKSEAFWRKYLKMD